jgi:hypothetical protein
VTFDKDGHPLPQIHLRNGEWQYRMANSYNKTEIRGIYYFKGLHEDTEHALLELQDIAVGGSSTDTGIFLVFEVRDGELYTTQQIEYDDHSLGTFARFFPEGGWLFILGRTADSSPHCCPDSYTDVILEWDGKEFQVRNAEKLLLEKKAPNPGSSGLLPKLGPNHSTSCPV